MIFLEAFVRSGTAVIAFLGAFLFFSAAHKPRYFTWIALFLISLASGAIVHTANGLSPPLVVRTVLLPVSSSFIVFLWIAARSYFEDEFRFSSPELTVFCIWLALFSFDYLLLVANDPAANSSSGAVRQWVSYALVGHTVYTVLSGKSIDLVEHRKRARSAFVITVLAIYLLNRGGEIVFGYSALPIWFTALVYGLIFALLSIALFALARFDTVVFEPSFAEEPGKPAEEPLSAEQQSLVDRLNDIMTVQQAFLEPELSIRDLAGRVGIGEHQLRALINQALGYRNFRAFLNGYRVQHALSLLSSSTHFNHSMLDIAMRSGFGSLASFNRIFKAETGSTPRDVRSAMRETETPEKFLNSETERTSVSINT